MDQQFELIIWDCDGVLVDSERISSRVFAKIIRDLGGEVGEQEVHFALRGGSMKQSLDFVNSRVTVPEGMDVEKLYRQLSFEYFKRELKQIQGVEQVLKSLSTPVCIASNGPGIKIRHNLSVVGLDAYFSEGAIFSGYDLDLFKPSPGLFLHAARQMGTLPEKCAVIEDSEHGAVAAMNAGMTCFGFCSETTDVAFLKHKAIPFTSMQGLLELLAAYSVVNL